jgi:hypothetical protein
MRNWHGNLSPFGLWHNAASSALAVYAVLGFKPQLVLDFDDEKYFTRSTRSTFSDAITHTRAGNATMVDSDGVLKWAPHNLLTYSEQFDNAALGKSGATVDDNAVAAPDGSITADKLVENFGSVAPIISNSSASVLSSSVAAGRGIYVKSAGDGRFVQMAMNDAIAGNRVLAVINPDTGQTAAAAGVTASSSLISDGWYLFSVSFGSAATTNNAQIRTAPTSAAWWTTLTNPLALRHTSPPPLLLDTSPAVVTTSTMVARG